MEKMNARNVGIRGLLGAAVIGIPIALSSAIDKSKFEPSSQKYKQLHGITLPEDVERFQTLVAQDVASKLCKRDSKISLDMPNPFNGVAEKASHVFDIDIQGPLFDNMGADLQSRIYRSNAYQDSYTVEELQNLNKGRNIKNTPYYEDKASSQIIAFANHYDTKINNKIIGLLDHESDFCKTDFNTLFKLDKKIAD